MTDKLILDVDDLATAKVEDLNDALTRAGQQGAKTLERGLVGSERAARQLSVQIQGNAQIVQQSSNDTSKHTQVIVQNQESAAHAALAIARMYFVYKSGLVGKAINYTKVHKVQVAALGSTAAVAATAIASIYLAVGAVVLAFKGMVSIVTGGFKLIEDLAKKGNHQFEQMQFEIEQVSGTWARFKEELAKGPLLKSILGDAAESSSRLAGLLQLGVENVSLLNDKSGILTDILGGPLVASVRALLNLNKNALQEAAKRAALENQRAKIHQFEVKIAEEGEDRLRQLAISRLDTLNLVNQELNKQNKILKANIDGTLAGQKASEGAMKSIIELRKQEQRILEQTELLRERVVTSLERAQKSRGMDPVEQNAKQIKGLKDINSFIERRIALIKSLESIGILTPKRLEKELEILNTLIAREAELKGLKERKVQLEKEYKEMFLDFGRQEQDRQRQAKIDRLAEERDLRSIHKLRRESVEEIMKLNKEAKELLSHEILDKQQQERLAELRKEITRYAAIELGIRQKILEVEKSKKALADAERLAEQQKIAQAVSQQNLAQQAATRLGVRPVLKELAGRRADEEIARQEQEVKLGTRKPLTESDRIRIQRKAFHDVYREFRTGRLDQAEVAKVQADLLGRIARQAVQQGKLSQTQADALMQSVEEAKKQVVESSSMAQSLKAIEEVVKTFKPGATKGLKSSLIPSESAPKPFNIPFPFNLKPYFSAPEHFGNPLQKGIESLFQGIGKPGGGDKQQQAGDVDREVGAAKQGLRDQQVAQNTMIQSLMEYIQNGEAFSGQAVETLSNATSSLQNATHLIDRNTQDISRINTFLASIIGSQRRSAQNRNRVG